MSDRGRTRDLRAAEPTDRDGDETVSRQYREAARERTPAALDERVRARARRAPVRRRWQRPLAIAATLALAVSLVLQVSAPPDEPAPPPAGSAATESATDEAMPAAMPENRPENQSPPGAAATKGFALQPDRGDAGQALTDLERAGRRAAEALRREAGEPGSLRCTEHVDDAKAWQDCIAALEAAGEDAAAARERAAWEARHGRGAAVAN